MAVCGGWLGACSKLSFKRVERYENAELVLEKDINHPHYQAYKVGSVFFGAYVSGLNETTVDGGPPFSVNIGAYSLADDSAQVTLLEAEVLIKGQGRVDVLSEFTSHDFEVLTEPDQARFDESGSYGSEWLHTENFLYAYPSKDEALVLYFRVRVQSGTEVMEGEVEFEFTPRVQDIPFFRGPSV